MCGRLNVIDDPAVRELCKILGIKLYPENEALLKRYIGAANKVNIVFSAEEGQLQMQTALWWLLLDKAESGFKPSKYTSFNTRYDKLNVPRSAGYTAFRESRCIIPVKGFGETQGKGMNASYTDFCAVEGGLALGGLYRRWFDKETGESAISCSIITLPPHPKLEQYHQKSMPLILPQNQWLKNWLNPNITSVEEFTPLLNPFLPQSLYAQAIDKPSSYNSTGTATLISAD